VVVGVGEELRDGAGGAAADLVLPVAAEVAELTSDLGRCAGEGAAWRLRAEQVGVPSGISPVRWDDPEVASRTLVIALGWSLLRRSRPDG
jgi:hypothetical protein